MSHPYQLRSTATHTIEGRPSGAGAVRSLASSELAEEMETYRSDGNRTARVASPTPQLPTPTAASPEAVEQSQQQPQAPSVTSSSTASHGPVDDERPSIYIHTLGHTVLDGDPVPQWKGTQQPPLWKFTGAGFACVRIIRAHFAKRLDGSR